MATRYRSLWIAAALFLAAGLTVSSGAQEQAPAWPHTSLTGWRQVAYIKASHPVESDQFGFAIALSRDGHTLAVGAPQESSGAAGINGDETDESTFAAGAVYLYRRTPTLSGGRWTQEAYIKASNPGVGHQFGYSLSLSADGNTLAVSAPYEAGGATGIGGNQADQSVPDSGAVYVFTRAAGAWSQQAYIKASHHNGDRFGFAVSLSGEGNTLAVGQPSEASAPGAGPADSSTTSAGAVSVFTRAGGTWSQQAFLKSSSFPANAGGELFGYSVALNDDGRSLAVGAYDERGCSNFVDGPYVPGCNGTGALYVFRRNGDTWEREAYLKAAAQTNQDSMGNAIAISGDGSTVAGGAFDEDSLTTGINGVVANNQHLNTSTGAAHVFVRDEPRWRQQANFKASNTGIEDWFAHAVALDGSGDTLVVTAPNEDSASSRIDGDQDDESAPQAGAAYVFRRSGRTWTQESYIKAFNAGEFHEFGSAGALSSDGRTMAVGARFESGGSSGVNGNHYDQSRAGSGAVYVFGYFPPDTTD